MLAIKRKFTLICNAKPHFGASLCYGVLSIDLRIFYKG